MIEPLEQFVATRLSHLVSQTKAPVVPIQCIVVSEFKSWLSKQSEFIKTWISDRHFQPESNDFILIPKKTGELAYVLACVDLNNQPMNLFARLVETLPTKVYQLQCEGILQTDEFIQQASFAWGLQRYQFLNYKKNSKKTTATLLLSESIDKQTLFHTLQAIFLVRDLINVPANDMTPEQLSIETKKVASLFRAKFRDICDEKTLKKEYPAIYAV